MSDTKNNQASRSRRTKKGSNRNSSKNRTSGTKESVPGGKENPYKKISELKSEIHTLNVLRLQDRVLHDQELRKHGNLSGELEATKEKMGAIADIAASIDFIACARDVVVYFECLHLPDFPIISDLMSEIKETVPSFINLPTVQGAHCTKLFWILLKGDERSSKPLERLRDNLERNEDRYLTFSRHMEELFCIFANPLQCNLSLEFSHLSKRKILKYTSRLQPELKLALRMFHKSFKTA